MLLSVVYIQFVWVVIESQSEPSARIDCHPEPYPDETDQFGIRSPAFLKDSLIPPLFYITSSAAALSAFCDQRKSFVLAHPENDVLGNWYEPPIDFPRKGSLSNDEFLITTGATGPHGTFAFIVTRKSTNIKIWDTSIGCNTLWYHSCISGGLLFSDQYIQIATYLPTKNIYGFGEHIHKSLKHNMDRYTTWPMYAHGVAPDSYAGLSTRNLYGVHPFYMAVEEDGNAHGVLILNSNVQEVTLGPGPHLVYRTLGGNLDIYFFPGPTPEEVVQQYLAFIGTPFMPAYWAFGYQLGRRGYTDLADMMDKVNVTVKGGIPLEIVVADIEYMEDNKVFTLGWKELPVYANHLHQLGIHLSIVVNPQVQVNYSTFQRAMDMKARFVEWPEARLVDGLNKLYPLTNGTLLMLSNAWPSNNTATVDFMDPSGNTEKWWTNEFKLFHQQVAFDSVWLDMNEPTNFFVEPAFGVNSLVNWNHLRCPINGADGKYDNPRYATWASYIYEEVKTLPILLLSELFTHTLCSLGKVAAGKYNLYDTHNLYGLRMTTYMHEVHDKILKTRGAVISRSTFPSAGRYSGHFLGQNSALWEDLQTSIIGIIEFNIFGIPFVGADICGYSANSNEELCIRWHQLGAFYPLSRLKLQWSVQQATPSNIFDQGGKCSKEIATFQIPLPTLLIYTSYSHLCNFAYFISNYRLFYLANRNGGTVIRPLFFEFPTDVSTYDISYQFMWGSGMLVAPVVSKGRKTVDAYFPPSATWAPDMNPLHIFAEHSNMISGDVIIPRQAPAQFLRDARNQPFELLITLEANDKEVIRNASGSLYWDDGESFMGEDYYFLRFSFTANNYFATLTISHSHSGKVHIPTLDIIEIFGYSYFPDFSTITFSGFPLKVNQTTFCAQTNILRMQGTRMIDWSAPGIIQLMWNHSRKYAVVDKHKNFGRYNFRSRNDWANEHDNCADIANRIGCATHDSLYTCAWYAIVYDEAELCHNGL
ncbi:unnamed protein product [Toxocara canis]|uniref:Sucrase-isomaltase n=1 Tax=Toxocara canis TaxID=6265 RepID=A0A183TVC0_TOXCA|nr:unnamed protein product [Toxocara canis]